MNPIHLSYPAELRKRGLSAVWASVASLPLFAFFLLAGFGEHAWAWIAFGIVTAALLALLLYGISQVRSGTGRVEITQEGVAVERGRNRVTLRWEQMDPVRLTGGWHPGVCICSGEKRAAVYRGLVGYPLLWSLLAAHGVTPAAPQGSLTVHCRRTQNMGILLAAAAMALCAAGLMILLTVQTMLQPLPGAALCVLFAGLTALCLWAVLHPMATYTFTADGVLRRGWFRETRIPAADLRTVALVQAPIRLLATGYRYRGPAMTRQVQLEPRGLGLVVRLTHASGELCVDDTMTGFAPEVLYDELCRRYGLPGTLSMPETGNPPC